MRGGMARWWHVVVSEWQHTWGGGGGGRGAWGFQSGLGMVSRGSAVEETIGYGRWMNGRWQQRSGNGCMGRQYHHGDGRCQHLLAAGKDKTTKMQRMTMSTKSSASTSGPVSYTSLGVTMLTGAGIFYWYSQQKEKKLSALPKQAVVAGKAAMGGPFELIDGGGKVFTEKDLLGRFSLLYFGFTHCPDVCPDELEKIAEAVDMVAKKHPKGEFPVPVFITLDPERDGVKQVGAYVKEFHPAMIGLTGSPEAVKAAAKAYRVYYSRAGVGEISGNETSDDDDYLIDHSIISYLVDPKGEFVTFYGKNYSAEEMAASMSDIMSRWQE